MTINLPVSLTKISKSLPKEILAEGMLLAIQKRIKEEGKLVKQAEKKITSFRKRYKCIFSHFPQGLFAKKSGKGHEDWVEWSFWEKVHQQAKEDLGSYSKIYRHVSP